MFAYCLRVTGFISVTRFYLFGCLLLFALAMLAAFARAVLAALAAGVCCLVFVCCLLVCCLVFVVYFFAAVGSIYYLHIYINVCLLIAFVACFKAF